MTGSLNARKERRRPVGVWARSAMVAVYPVGSETTPEDYRCVPAVTWLG